jgi:hypothetical protein
MISYITADEQKQIRLELEEVQGILQTVFARLRPLDRSDERVVRTEAALASIERVLWTMTSGPGRMGPAVPVRAILPPAVSLYLVSKEARRA